MKVWIGLHEVAILRDDFAPFSELGFHYLIRRPDRTGIIVDASRYLREPGSVEDELSRYDWAAERIIACLRFED